VHSTLQDATTPYTRRWQTFVTILPHETIDIFHRLTMRHITPIFIIPLLIVGQLFSSCGKEDTATPPSNQSFKGDFVSGAHSTSGIASIDSNEAILTLTNFKTDSGPDLNIYLASTLNSITSDYIDLGDIKGLNGTYAYDLPDNTDFLHYRYVVVWCVDFDINFGFAGLIKQ
jgi:hypothetical protein